MYISIFLFATGIFAIICTILKPSFYWESRKAKQFRRLIGDTAASIFYIFLGVILSCMAIANLLGIITL